MSLRMRCAAALAVGLMVLCGSAQQAGAQRTLVIEQFAADVRVTPDGDVDVTETIRARFTGSWNGLYRSIPVEYRTPQGFNYTLRLDLQAVTDETGRSLKYDSSREGHYRKIKIWIPGAAWATRTVVIRYRVRNALRFFDEHDELYWNVTGDEWEVPIQLATAVVHLPTGAQGVRTASFTGGYGSVESAAMVTVAGSDVSVRTTRVLNFREGLTLAVGWNPGLVARPGALQKAGAFLASNGVLFAPLFVLAVMGWVWWRHGRDPRRNPVTVQYEPPASLTPGELGTLVDNKPDMRDITASLVDLAVRGYLRIEEKDEEQFFGLSHRKEYTLALLKPEAAWQGLLPHEEALLKGIFDRTAAKADPAAPLTPGPGSGSPVVDSVQVSELKNRFYKHLPAIRTRILDRLVSLGYYRRRPDQVLTYSMIAALGVGVGVAIVGGWIMGRLGESGPASVIAGVLSFGVVALLGQFMPARTEQGTRVLEGALGFEEFLDRVEADRLERTVRTPEMFEKFLPFAMALGVERNWAKAFEGIYTTPPTWYQGGRYQTFQPRAFVSSLGGLSSSAGAAMSAAPRSSGGSGFSGGGSGGGFGGGGGGGF